MNSYREIEYRFEIFQENFEYCLARDPFIKRLLKAVQNLELEVEELKKQVSADQ